MNKKAVISTVLTCLGAIGVVVTSVMAVKAVPKAELRLAQAEDEKGDKLTRFEEVKAAAPAYAPAIATGVATIACILGANILNQKYQASLISAYALLDNSYTEYKNKVKELYGEDADERVKEEISKDYYEEEEYELPNGEQLFFDFTTLRYFTAPMEEVIQKVTLEGGNECYIISTPPPFME